MAIGYALEHIDRGAEAAGRARRPHVTVFAYGAIDEDEESAIATRPERSPRGSRRPPRCTAAWPVLTQAIIDQVRASYSGGEFQEAAKAAAALPVEFVKRMALAGGRSEAAAAHRHAGAKSAWTR